MAKVRLETYYAVLNTVSATKQWVRSQQVVQWEKHSIKLISVEDNAPLKIKVMSLLRDMIL